ncbi:MAG: hypothetical protein WAV45_17025 [Propionibacteriaceae bacterium]
MTDATTPTSNQNGEAPWAAELRKAQEEINAPAPPFDPLRLCIFSTVALLGWLFGPVTLLVFASIGFAGYLKARRAGLTRSKCYLRDTRLVLAYLALLVIAAGVGIWWRFGHGGWFA